MKVVQFLASNGWGGMENVFVSLCNELSKNIKIEVIVFDNNFIIDRLSKDIIIHRLFFSQSRFNPLLYVEIDIILNKIKPDIVHTHGAKATEIFYRLNKLLNIKHVATKHNSRKGSIFNKIEYVTTVSNDARKTIETRKVKVIYNGIEPVKLSFSNIKSDIFTILAVGRLDKIKGFDILIRECSKLDFDFRLNIVGDGGEKENLEKIIKELNLNDQVELIGFRYDIPELMNQADLVVVSSHNEGFSLVITEALFYAQMLISRNVGIAKEILPKNFLIDEFKIAEKINNVYNYLEQYKNQFFEFSKYKKAKFMLSNIGKEYINYYIEILDKNYTKKLTMDLNENT